MKKHVPTSSYSKIQKGQEFGNYINNPNSPGTVWMRKKMIIEVLLYTPKQRHTASFASASEAVCC